MYKLVFALTLSSLIAAAISEEEIYGKCADNYQCLENKFTGLIDSLDEQQTVNILGDFLVVQKISENIPRKSDHEGFFERCARYLASHELKVRLPSSEMSGRSMVAAEARTKKLRRIILPFLLLLKLKAAVVITAALSLVALVAFKGLGAGLVALAISGAVGFKTLLDAGHQGSKLTYEVVPQIAPHWSRTGVDPVVSQGYHTIR